MSRSSTTWTPTKLPEEIQEMIGRVADLTPAMRDAARAEVPVIQGRLQRGDPSWPDVSPETIKRRRFRGAKHTGTASGARGFAPFVQPFWGVRNMGWKIPRPHAPLFSRGTQQYRSSRGRRTARWGSRAGGRRSRNVASNFLNHGNTAVTHQPPRFFEFLTDESKARSLQIVVVYVLGNMRDR